MSTNLVMERLEGRWCQGGWELSEELGESKVDVMCSVVRMVQFVEEVETARNVGLAEGMREKAIINTA